jgi:hypothetical protein
VSPLDTSSPSSPTTASPDRAPWRVVELSLRALATAFLAVVAYGLIWLPYYGDQALYASIGRELLDGRTLYSQVWDLKQPGIFLWYGAAQAAFGSSPVVTRALDVLVAVVAALLVGSLVRDRVSPTIARWVPLAAAAAMLLPARSLDLGQVEQLACLPMTAALVLLCRRPSRLRTVLAGVCIGVVAVLKLWLAVVLLAAGIVWLLAGGSGPDRARKQIAVRVGLLVAGAAVPVAAVLGWLWAGGALGTALWTWFVFPEEMLALPGVRTPDRLVAGLGRYVALLAPIVLLAGVQVVATVRRRDPLGLALLSWLVIGTAETLAQLWWPYHWWQLTPALVAMAALGLERLRERGLLRRRPIAAVLVVATLPLIVFGAFRPERPLLLGNGFTTDSRADLEALGTVPTARAELAAVGFGPGRSLLVFGDPTYHLVADAPSPVRLNTWSPELYTDEQWAELATDIASARPDLVLVTPLDVDVVPQRGPQVAAVLAADYDRVRSTDAGDWYRHRGAGR